jgi:6-hydroxycyclohex-1-ene-1-carbonyl-CoA dehydrogenase
MAQDTSKTPYRWVMTGVGAPMVRETFAVPEPAAGQVVVEIAGCGVCHTDLGYLHGDVPPRKKGPLVLGHEASGVVLEAADDVARFVGRRVIVPAVWPCGQCAFCKSDRRTACTRSIMPGNDVDGAFASLLEAPAEWLCDIDGDGPAQPEDSPIGHAQLALWEVSVLADAVTTPLQAVKRAHLKEGELAVVVGVGGVGSFGLQIARALGATVVAIDVAPERLELARTLGAHAVLDGREPLKALRAALKGAAATGGVRHESYKVFEMSGSKAGQELAFSLLNRGGHLAVVGFTPEAPTIRLSNLMALDATAAGNWGSDPAIYGEALSLVATGAVQLKPLVRREPLAEAPRVLEAVAAHQFRERVVLIP